jgi:hypothetical protein
MANDSKRTDRLLKEAYDLGEQREKMLLAHCDWAALDEGLYAFAYERHLRQWHSNVKKVLGIDTPSAFANLARTRPESKANEDQDEEMEKE